MGIVNNEIENVEVEFNKYCPICKSTATDEVESPCTECLEQPYNVNSEKPVKFVEK